MKNKKILGFMPVFYSGDYMKEALLSVEPYVDKMVIAYTATPSHGNFGNVVNPDNEQDIYNLALEILKDKLIWDREPSYPSEAHHRHRRYDHAIGFDAILSVDCDEVMLGIPEALEYAFAHEEEHFGLTNYVNFFRSFSWACYDGFRPIRISVMGRHNGLQNLNCPMTVLHFSCCQNQAVMEAKYKSFGHASEIRPNYLEEIFYKWTPEGNIEWLHPVSLQIWQKAEFYDKNLMPEYLHHHMNFNKDLIL